MECIRCGNEEDCTFFIERIPCPHCEEYIDVEYNTCTKCALLWKTVNGEVVDGTVFDENGPIVDGISGFDMGPVMEELKDMASNTIKDNMSDYLHTCLMCGGIANETSPRRYKCLECGFEWESEEA